MKKKQYCDLFYSPLMYGKVWFSHSHKPEILNLWLKDIFEDLLVGMRTNLNSPLWM